MAGAGTRWPNDPYPGVADRYAVVRDVFAGRLDTATVIRALGDAGLRGMGGAGFPTGRKWDLVSIQPTPTYVICNADESEPGTFKDRQILATQAHLVLEGMLLGMLAVGAEQAWVFIRHEYGPEEQVIRAELAHLRALGLLGTDVLGTGRRLSIEVFTSPGGYILGEESALIECMEGHRGEPRNKPPFPAAVGLHGRPTLMNSVETFAHIPLIALRGAQHWRDQGNGDHAGWKFFAVSGHVERPGVYCVPMGTTARELLELAGGVLGGRALGAIQPGGASSNFLGPGQLDVELDFATLQGAGSMLGSGAMVVMAAGTDLLAAAVNVLRFFRDESCGKCVPCRVGSTKAHLLLEGVLARGGGPADIPADVTELITVLRRTSICGLGQVALGPVASVARMAGAPGGERP
jgi:formate dehydrogenase/NADH-quinone oxidoreductase subunit F